jgi:hypothetical protein
VLEKLCFVLVGGWLVQGIIYTGGWGWYRMCSCQTSVGLVVKETKQKKFFALTANS